MPSSVYLPSRDPPPPVTVRYRRMSPAVAATPCADATEATRSNANPNANGPGRLAVLRFRRQRGEPVGMDANGEWLKTQRADVERVVGGWSAWRGDRRIAGEDRARLRRRAFGSEAGAAVPWTAGSARWARRGP